jgi:hypothetical protein
MNKHIHTLRNSNLTGGFLATVIIFSSANTIWPMYLWLHKQWALLNEPIMLFWWFCGFFFAFWVWLILFLSKEYTQYPGMSIDALIVGSLLTVAAVLRDADVLSDLSKKGFGAAAWVVYLSTCVLAVRIAACMSKINKRTGEPSSNSVGDESLSTERR